MLQLKYDFFEIFLRDDMYQEEEMDTDSFYISIGAEDLESCMFPEKVQAWKDIREQDCSLGSNFIPDVDFNWFPRTCCAAHAKLDKRTPGLFKEEWSGTMMVSLCSKTYCGFDELTKTSKYSCKGVQKSNITEDTVERYKSVLETGKNLIVANRGFRVRKSEIFTYIQEKVGLSYFYAKRKVLDDGIKTRPLDL